MHNVDQFFRGSHYNIIRILLSGSGLWPFHTIATRYMIYLAMILILGSGLLLQLIGLSEMLQNTYELIDSLPLLLLEILTACKLICLVYMLPKIKLLLIKMQEYCLSPKSSEEYKIQNVHAVYGRNYSYAYTSIVLVQTGFMTFLTALLRFGYIKSDKNITSLNKVHNVAAPRLPSRIDLDTYYVPIFIHISTCEISNSILLVVFDVLYLTMVEHCCGLFAALRYRIESAFVVGNIENNGLTRTYIKDKCYLNIAYSLRRHAEAIQFVAIFNSIYSIPLLLHVVCAMLILSAVGLQMTSDMENISYVFNHCIYLSVCLINIFFENWQGQKMIDSSEKVFESAYNTKWYNMPIAARKLLVMVMMKSIKPSIVSAGNKLIILSYVTFNATVRMSMSYFMLFRSIQ